MTGFEKFQQKIKDGIPACLPEEYRNATVNIVHVPRNNDQEQVAMAIKKEGQSVAAKVYLEEYYTRFPDWVSDETILRTIAGDYLAEESEMKWKAEMAEAVKDFDSVKGNIRVQVVNKDMNRENLRGCPHKEVEGTDLAAVFRVMLYKDGEERATALVTDKTMKDWDMGVDSLYETALKNTAAQAPAQINSMMSLLFGGEEPLAPEEVFREEGFYFYPELHPLPDGGTGHGIYVGGVNGEGIPPPEGLQPVDGLSQGVNDSAPQKGSYRQRQPLAGIADKVARGYPTHISIRHE